MSKSRVKMLTLRQIIIYKMRKLFYLTLAACMTVTAMAQNKGPEWLSHAVIYQIYPSSFMDSDDDGIGDITGMIERLDYVQRLGANTIWLCPMFCSAWQDGGYDVTDFYHIDPRFGTDDDMKRLINEIHVRGMRVCLDLVAGHTSDQHPWFKASGQLERNTYTDYYMWTDSIPPDEYRTLERRHRTHDPAIATWGSYGMCDAPRAKYYRKNYFEFQPALNYGYANPDLNDPVQQSIDSPGPQAVRQELRNIISHWFDMGVDGFRVDMASSLIKNDPDKRENIKLWQQMRRWIDERYPRHVLIAEWSQPEQSLEAGFHIDFMIHFGLRGYDALFFPKGAPDCGPYDYCYFDASGLGDATPFITNFTQAYQATRDKGYISIPTSNHDIIRSNYGTRNTVEQLKVKMLFHLTMPGVPCIYYGDEIGMKYQPGLPDKEGSGHRAGSRTPMQWSEGWNAGYSMCDPRMLYLPIDYEGGAISVEAQEQDKNSLLHFTRDLIKLRHQIPALDNDGSWQMLSDPSSPYPMVYQREKDGQRVVVVINPSGKKASAVIPSCSINGKPVIKCGSVSYHGSKQGDHVVAHAFSAAVFQ